MMIDLVESKLNAFNGTEEDALVYLNPYTMFSRDFIKHCSFDEFSACENEIFNGFKPQKIMVGRTIDSKYREYLEENGWKIHLNNYLSMLPDGFMYLEDSDITSWFNLPLL